ncbi:GGDEF domain-containing protein [Azohydromonas sp.]|mgnify:CR=1 FL=1|uniref:GGDEF domain-containing protein n=1 Tax=Azohydromonas sp. TaxID=1872666 RepID=UPI002BF69976|nr:GGDEF domain-containing protein [Azohydromonas sp.]HMM85674.1 GGDEF domain-containing protein [Azohydromonas sp.]
MDASTWLHLPTLLLLSAGVAFATALATTAASVGAPLARGAGWWLGGQWLVFAGLAVLTMTVGHDAAAVIGLVLLLPWPVLVLMGLRRFHARQRPRGHAAVDAVVLVLAVAAVLVEAARDTPGAVWNAAMAALHGYALIALLGSAVLRVEAPLRVLCALLAVAVAGHGALALATGLDAAVPAAAAAAPLSAVLSTGMGFVALLLAHERTVSELRDSRRRLRFLANIDMLTQVPNRRHFGELARRVLQRHPDRTAAVLMFDIDHFKRINDELGHAAGDRALRLVARCVQDTLRANDVAGRHGGDEFVLLLPRTELRDAMAVATRIVHRAQRLANEQAVPRLSLSFGVVQLRDDESLDEALRRADQALYEAKRQGRGRAVSAAGDELRPVFVESRRLGLA